MTITIQELRFAGTDGATAAGTLLAKVAQHLYHQGAAYSRKVMLPLRQRKEWTGAGQPQADAVVAADGVAIYTAASRVQHAANTMRLFAAVIGLCKSTVDATMTKAESKGMTIASDGTVTPGDDAGDDEKKAADRYTKTLHKQLTQARHIDRLCADTLRRLCGHKAHGHDGYDLPVYSATYGNHLYERSAKAFNESYASKWNPYDFRYQPGRDEWWQALAGTFPPCVLGKPDAVTGGGGFVVGPDMRLYPLVTVSSTNQTDGKDGWRTLFTRAGHKDLAPDPVRDRRAAMQLLFGALAGANYGSGTGAADKKLTQSLAVDAPVSPTLPRPLTTYPEREHGYGDAAAANTVMFPVQAVGAGLDGWERGQQVAGSHYYAYQTVFQQNDAGQLRAVVKTYQVVYDQNGVPAVAPTQGYLDSNGHYHHAPFHEPVTMRAPRQYMLPDGTVITR